MYNNITTTNVYPQWLKHWIHRFLGIPLCLTCLVAVVTTSSRNLLLATDDQLSNTSLYHFQSFSTSSIPAKAHRDQSMSLLVETTTATTLGNTLFPTHNTTFTTTTTTTTASTFESSRRSLKTSHEENKTTYRGMNKKTALFYNVYMNADNLDNAERLVHEHTTQMRDLLIQSTYLSLDTVSLYYNLIGYNYTGSICPFDDFYCNRLRYYPRAQEVVTLQDLSNYCRANPQDRVVYLHDKGSFHGGTGNNRLRRMSTKAVLSDACHSMGSSSTTDVDTRACNICTLRFQTTPHVHVPGNFFTADCNYINRLIQPLNYDEERKNLCRTIVQVQQQQKNDKNKNNICPSNLTIIDELQDSWDYGFGRFASERWIASSPRLVACETFVNATMRSFVTGWETFIPTLTKSTKPSRRMNEAQTKALLLLMHEYAYSHKSMHPTTGFCQHYFPKQNKCPQPSRAFLKHVAVDANNTGTPSSLVI